MAYEQKDMTGTLFKNDRRTGETHPHAKGKALIAGVWYWISAWTKEPKGGGDRFQSLSFTEMTPEQAQQAGGGQPVPRQQFAQDRQQQDAPGYGGPPQGTYQANRAARKAGKPAPAIVEPDEDPPF